MALSTRLTLSRLISASIVGVPLASSAASPSLSRASNVTRDAMASSPMASITARLRRKRYARCRCAPVSALGGAIELSDASSRVTTVSCELLVIADPPCAAARRRSLVSRYWPGVPVPAACAAGRYADGSFRRLMMPMLIDAGKRILTELWTSERRRRPWLTGRCEATNDTGIAMKRTSCAAEAALPCRRRVVTRLRDVEFPGLAMRAHTACKSGKFPAQPLGNQAGGDGLADSPRSNVVHRERIADRQTEQLREGPGTRTHLHPQLEHGACLLPGIVQAPPTLEIVKQRLDSPSAPVELNDQLRVQVHFGGQDQTCLCPRLPFVVVELTPDRAHGSAPEEAGHGEYRAQAHALILAVESHRQFGCGQRFDGLPVQPLAIDARSSTPGCFGRRGWQEQRGIDTRLTDHMHVPAQQRQDQPRAHEPRVEQHTYGPVGHTAERANKCQRNPELVGVARLGNQARKDGQDHANAAIAQYAHAQGHDALGPDVLRPVGLAAVFASPGDAGRLLRAAHVQRVVQNQGEHIAGQDRQHQPQQRTREPHRAQAAALQEFVIRRPVPGAAAGRDRSCHPSLGRDHAAAQQLYERGLRAKRHGGKQNIDPFGKTKLYAFGQGHGQAVENRKRSSLAAALLALKPRASSAAASRMPAHVKLFSNSQSFFSRLIRELNV